MSQVLVYDLRSPKTPMKTFIAHNTSVSSMVFKHKVDKQQVAQVMSVVKSRSKLSQQKSTPSLRTVHEETKENTEPATGQEGIVETDGMEKEIFGKPEDSFFTKDDSMFSTNRRESLSSQLFSPLRDADTSFPGSKVGYSVNKEPRRVSEVRLSSDGLFSPLREANSPTGSIGSLQMTLTQKTPNSRFTTPTMSPVSSIRKDVTTSQEKYLNIVRDPFNQLEKLSLERLDEFVKEASAGEKSPLFDMSPGIENNVADRFSIGESNNLVRGSLEEEKPSSIVKPNISISRSKTDDFLSVLTAFPDLGIEVEADHQGTGDHVKYVHLDDIIRY